MDIADYLKRLNENKDDLECINEAHVAQEMRHKIFKAIQLTTSYGVAVEWNAS